jgi:acetylornithine deacetylase/succinyl-diaminopimelate desuccinylase-like protein
MNDSIILEILSELVQYQTFSPDILNTKQFSPDFKVPESYYKCMKYIEKILKEANFKTENYLFEGFPMMLGWHQSKKINSTPRILLLMHFDVVPVEKSWENAFVMTVREDPDLGLVAEGRGVTDMKGSIAALLNSVKEISAMPNVDICLVFTSDEELGGFFGAKMLVKEIFLKKKNWMPNYVVTGDAADEEIINLRRNAHFIRATFPRIKKVLRGNKFSKIFKSTIRSSKTSHAAYFQSDIDLHAIYEASKYFKSNENEFVRILDEEQFIKSNVIPKEVEIETAVEDENGNEKFEVEVSFTEVIRILSDLLTIPLPKGRSSLGTNITPNLINFFDETFEILFDLRSMLSASENPIIEDSFRSLFSELPFEPQVEVEGSAGPIITEENSFLVQSAKKAWKNLTGTDINTAERAGTTDGRYFSYRGIESIDIGPIGFNIHGTKETVKIESLERLSAFFPEIVRILTEKNVDKKTNLSI